MDILLYKLPVLYSRISKNVSRKKLCMPVRHKHSNPLENIKDTLKKTS